MGNPDFAIVIKSGARVNTQGFFLSED